MRRVTLAACLVGLVGVLGAPVATTGAAEGFSPQAVDKAIEKGIRFLRSQAKDGKTGLWRGHEVEKGPKHFNYHPYGPSALATYALIEAGVSPRDPLVAKALGTGIGDMTWVEIEIVSDKMGRPELVLHGAARQVAEELGLAEWSVSLSHTENYAIGFVVAMG